MRQSQARPSALTGMGKRAMSRGASGARLIAGKRERKVIRRVGPVSTSRQQRCGAPFRSTAGR